MLYPWGGSFFSAQLPRGLGAPGSCRVGVFGAARVTNPAGSLAAGKNQKVLKFLVELPALVSESALLFCCSRGVV